jgi:CheY-like chemotaxis protein
MVKVLCIDDDESVARLMAEMVEFVGRNYGGYEAVTCMDTFEAIEHLKDRRIRAVVSDYMMPKLDGLEFLVVVQEQRPDVRRILLTAAPNESAVKDAKRSMLAMSVVAKPPSIRDMELALAWLSRG